MPRTNDEVELQLRVARKESAAEGTVILDLTTEGEELLPVWTPGAHIDLLLAPGLTRQYSLCGDTTDRQTWRVAVLLEPKSRGGSAYVHNTLHEGDLVRVRGPRNHFALVPSRRYLFIAGGIGITPILPMLAEASRVGAEWELHYGGKRLPTMAFLSELTAMAASSVHIHPQDQVGNLDLATILGTPEANTTIYCCGPGALLDAVEQRSRTWPTDALHMERFTPVHQAELVVNRSFEIELAQSGVTLEVQAEESIVQALRTAGVDVPSSCEEGTCGTCETQVLSGEVDHRDSLLTAGERAANDTMFICVSRAACPRLVLDR